MWRLQSGGTNLPAWWQGRVVKLGGRPFFGSLTAPTEASRAPGTDPDGAIDPIVELSAKFHDE
jgi:hypothetical protein